MDKELTQSYSPNATPEAASKAKTQSPETEYEIGKLYCDRGDFLISIPKIDSAAKGFLEQKKWDQFFECQNLLLRMYAEREQEGEINKRKEFLQDLVLKEGVSLNSKTYYNLAICASYKKQHDTALEYFQKALSLALSSDSKKDICYSLSGLAITYIETGHYEQALKEIYNLQVFFQCLDLPELKIATLIWNGNLLRRQGEVEKALDIFWQAYEEQKKIKNLVNYIYLLYSMGLAYLQKSEVGMAKLYLQLALRSLDKDNMVRMHRIISTKLQEIGGSAESSADLVFHSGSKSIYEKNLGKVDFKNQFILLDLLKLFIKSPGVVFSKEELVKKVWKQEYDPSIHDNKIYVTIKRLRKLIEPDIEKPKYIYRAKNGYYLNKSVKVSIES